MKREKEDGLSDGGLENPVQFLLPPLFSKVALHGCPASVVSSNPHPVPSHQLSTSKSSSILTY